MKKTFLILTCINLLIVGISILLQHKDLIFNVLHSKRFMSESPLKFKDTDKENERETDGEENKKGDDALVRRKEMFDFRAYPGNSIPVDSKLKAFEQFQKLYPENQGLRPAQGMARGR